MSVGMTIMPGAVTSMVAVDMWGISGLANPGLKIAGGSVRLVCRRQC